MSNPYEAPTGGVPIPAGGGQLPPPQEPGLVGQVRIVSILMIVQGALDLLYGISLVGMGIFMGLFMHEAIAENPQFQQGDGPSPDVIVNLASGFYAILGAVLGIIGALHIFAGYRNWKYRGRTLGIVSLVVGVGTFLTLVGCYCTPTSIALCIYGLIVYLNPSVAAAFRMGEEGYSGDEIAMTFSRLRYEQTPFKP